jgi:hypothetical protein
MAQSYKYLREQVVQGVIRGSANPPPLDRVRAIFDGSFFSVNSSLSEAFAAINSKRELLRAQRTLTFSAGSAALPSDTLKKYVEDGTFVDPAHPSAHYGFRKYAQYIRGSDPRLGAWTTIGESILATKPAAGGLYSGPANFTAIYSPPVPTSETSDFDAPEDYISDFINAMIQFILGETGDNAAASA